MSEELLDRAVPMRDEDALPIAAVHGWLTAQVPGLTGTPEITQFIGGASNLTYLVSYPDREFVLRTPPAGRKAASSHDMSREARFMTALAGHFPVPTVVAIAEAGEVIDRPLYAMDRVRGLILRADLPAALDVREATVQQMADRFIDLLVQLHSLDPEALGLSDLDRGPGYVQRQVSGWNDRYRAARTEGAPDAEAVMQWLVANQPPDRRRCLIHNDWRFDNLILDPTDPTRVLAVLDWEMATVGDPLMDLGGAMAYWIESDDDPTMQLFRRQPSHVAGMPTRAEFVAAYCDRAGIDLGSAGFTFYQVFGLFRLAVIAQQIYYRYAHGQTHNPSFEPFAAVAATLVQRCSDLIDQP